MIKIFLKTFIFIGFKQLDIVLPVSHNSTLVIVIVYSVAAPLTFVAANKLFVKIKQKIIINIFEIKFLIIFIIIF